MSFREKKQRIHRLTKQDLFQLLNKSDEDLLFTLNKTSFGFEPFLRNQYYLTRNNVLDFHTFDCIMDAIYRVCTMRCDNYLTTVNKLLNIVTSCEKFLFEDVFSLIYECLNCEEAFELARFTTKYVIVLKTIMRRKLHNTQQIIDVAYPALQNILNEMQNKRIKDFRYTKYEYDKLKKLVDRWDVSFASDEIVVKVSTFRQLSIMPKDNDVINCTVSDLPHNKILGPYQSVDHYLSVHFRLMREDMLRLFRKHIFQYMNPRVEHQSGARTYEQVNMQFPPIFKPEGVVYEIKIQRNKLIDWSKKEVLMKGNLLCLTKDNYNSVTLAIVHERSRSSKSKSTEYEAEILLEDSSDEVLEAGVNYRMFETNASYFKCYRHVLGAIKEFDESSLPLADFLVYFDFKNPEPEYLVNSNFLKGIVYCLHEKCDLYDNRVDPPTKGIIGEKNNEKNAIHKLGEHRGESFNMQVVGRNSKRTISCDCKKFDPLKYIEWPSATELEMDDKQFKAFQLALTKKVSVIQGPPGTGKTFIGVKIVKALLQNVPLTPIVICCHTNHALDQFLIHILKYTNNVVRLGSQSKSNVINPHSLENLMAAYQEYLSVCKNSVSSMENTMKTSLNHLKLFVPELLKRRPTRDFDPYSKEIKRVSHKLNMLYETFCICRDEYLCDSALNEIIDLKDKDQLRTGSETNSQYLATSVLEWLGCSKTSKLYEACESKFKKLKNLEIIERVPHLKLWSLGSTKRFELFYVWRERCLLKLLKNINDFKREYKKLRKTDYERPDPVAVEILQKAYVIGVTTTGAAKLKSLLRFINPKILLVEEAAAVLESHMISSLLPSIQHLILIGDHKQLQPLPRDNELAEVYNLKISMFERLFLNNAPSATLTSQHRMKPCIAELLIHKELYLDLKSYENVHKYDNIKGVKSSVFFLNHNKADSYLCSDASACNDYEAKMVVFFAKYLITNSYSEDQITILATYAAQVALIQKYLKEMELIIIVTTIDNYQGEENDIVLVSFVRSNKHGSIGFLKENNRVCVALSRARKGLFCLGNFSSYSSQSSLWGSIVQKLEVQDMFGPKLPLMCNKHMREIPVENPEHIQKLLSQGCNDICGTELSCGHHCLRKCHYDDPEHIQYQCSLPCEKYVTETKKCSRQCFEICQGEKHTIYLDCGHPAKSRKDGTIIPFCVEKAPKMLPCNHEAHLPCSTDLLTYKCRASVRVDLSCGHQAYVLCHVSKDLNHIICNNTIPDISPCGHTVPVPCSSTLDSHEILSFCTNSCGQKLNCGHACTGNCRSCYDTGIHHHCNEKCDKRIECGHECHGYCGSPCLPCKQNCLLSCSHNTKCINSCYRTCSMCEKNCERRCDHGVCTKKCFEPCSFPPCRLPCSKKLPCGHTCIGLCGDPCPDLCRVCHEDCLTSGNTEHDHYVQLDDCRHIFEETILKEHINNCLCSFLWPDCPECKVPIKRSLRYKIQLLKAKDYVLASSDCSKAIEHVNFLLNSVVSSGAIVPAEFLEVYKKIAVILHRDQPTSGPLYVLELCLAFLADLMQINEALKKMVLSEKSVILQSRFETLLSWVCNHLTFATYQQLEEVGEAVKKLKSNLI